jgi:CO dehydrogenase nickel-insertion accessory protein CooC1
MISHFRHSNSNFKAIYNDASKNLHKDLGQLESYKKLRKKKKTKKKKKRKKEKKRKEIPKTKQNKTKQN